MSSTKAHLLLFSVVLVFSFCVSNGQKQPKPKAILFQIWKDTDVLQYYTTLSIGKTMKGIFVQTDVVLDLGGQFTWFNCDGYSLPTYRPVSCGSKKCEAAKTISCVGCNGPEKPGCTNNTCGVFSYNPFTNNLYSSGLGESLTYVYSTDGLRQLLSYDAPDFQYSCTSLDTLGGLSNKTKGMTGLSRTATSLHSQTAKQFKLPNKFALCMPSTAEFMLGHMFVGGGPYFMRPYGRDIAKELLTTPLIINPVSTAPIYAVGDPSDEYFIEVKSIMVDRYPIAINTSLLTISKEGDGGTKLSTITPFTTLETSIYKALIRDFRKAAKARKMKMVSSVAPFGACYSSKSVAKSQTGPVVPHIDLYLPSTHWRFYGANSMVAVNKDVLCLAFVDGGKKPRTSIVLGGHQMENYLIEFDLVSSKLGFSTSLLFRNTTCAQARFQ